MSGTALLLIDLQNDYFPGGRMALEGSPGAVAKAAAALAAFRARGLPVLHVRHLSVRPGATFFLPGTEGAEIHASVAPRAGEPVVEKNFPNGFRGTDLKARLERAGVQHLVVAGMMTHQCVDASVRQANDHGYRVTLLADACATRAQKFGDETVPARHVHAAFLAALEGAYAKVVATDEFLKTLPEST
ncbi:MAG: isochorismatase [Betaproteobacteria bacterium RIFCSPLOWO2_12_FULL_67_28]|nr:MAG: isochorismatase [Betaproteobacteria bacterium RIFCSPLOWO2_12_FULL_67_28]